MAVTQQQMRGNGAVPHKSVEILSLGQLIGQFGRRLGRSRQRQRKSDACQASPDSGHAHLSNEFESQQLETENVGFSGLKAWAMAVGKRRRKLDITARYRSASLGFVGLAAVSDNRR